MFAPDGVRDATNPQLTRAQDTYLFPLLDTEFEGAPVKVPYKYQDMLAAEYGQDALSKVQYQK